MNIETIMSHSVNWNLSEKIVMAKLSEEEITEICETSYNINLLCTWQQLSVSQINFLLNSYPAKTELIVKTQFKTVAILTTFSQISTQNFSSVNWYLFQQFCQRITDWREMPVFDDITTYFIPVSIFPSNYRILFDPIALIQSPNLEAYFYRSLNLDWSKETLDTIFRNLSVHNVTFDLKRKLFRHQNVPNPLAIFLNDVGAFKDDYNYLFFSWFDNPHIYQTIPLELLTEPFFSQLLKINNFFRYSNCSEEFLDIYARQTKHLSGPTIDTHWDDIFYCQYYSEDFALKYRHQNGFKTCSGLIKFSNRIVQFWKQLLIDNILCNPQTSDELFGKLISPYYQPNNGVRMGNYYHDFGTRWGDERWNKANYSHISFSGDKETLFNKSILALQWIENSILPNDHLFNLISYCLIRNHTLPGMFSPEICKNYPNFVNYAVKHCTLSDDVIYEMWQNCNLKIFDFINHKTCFKKDLIKDLIYYQILPEKLITMLLETRDTNLIYLLTSYQRFTPSQIDICVSCSPNWLIEFLTNQDFSLEARDHVYYNYKREVQNLRGVLKRYQFSNDQLIGLCRSNKRLDQLTYICMLGAFDIQTKLNNETELMLCLRASNFIPQDFLIINKKNLIIENCVAIKNILIKSILSDSYLEQFLKYYFSISENELSDTDWTNLINVQNPLSQSFISQFDNKINFDVFFRSSKSITIDQIKKYMNPNTNQPYLFMFNKWVTPEYKKLIIDTLPQIKWPKGRASD